MKKNSPILLVEDDTIDIKTTIRALKELEITNELYIASNGEEALELLNDPGIKKPCLILLDLNMPRMNGIEFLKAVKNLDDIKKIPVIILTTSREEQDIVESYNLGAAGYMVKPIDYSQFVKIIKALVLYWTLSELP